MAIGFGTAGTVSSTGTTSLSVAYPASIAAGDLLVCCVVNKIPTNKPTTPAGWTLQNSPQVLGGSGGQTTDSGDTYVSIYTKVADGTESGSLAITITGGTAAGGRMFRYTSATGAYLIAQVGGDAEFGWTLQTIIEVDPSTPMSNLALTSGDMVLVVFGSNSARIDITSTAITETGITFGTRNVRTTANSDKFTVGNNVSLYVNDGLVTAGTANTNPVPKITNTSQGADDPSGAIVVLRIRETGGGGSVTGAAVGTSATAAAAGGKLAAAGTATATSATTATAAGKLDAAGAAVATSASAAAAAGALAAAGAASPTSTSTASADGAVTRGGAADATSTTTAAAGAVVSYAGSASSSASSSASASGVVLHEAAAAATSVSTSTAGPSVAFVGAASAASVSAAGAAGVATYSGAAAATAVTSALAATAGDVIGAASATASSSATADASVAHPGSAAANSTSTATADAAVTRAASAAATTTSAASATAVVIYGGAASATALSSAAAAGNTGPLLPDLKLPITSSVGPRLTTSNVGRNFITSKWTRGDL